MHQKLKQNCNKYEKWINFNFYRLTDNNQLQNFTSRENNFDRNHILFTSQSANVHKLRILNFYVYENQLNKKIVFTLINSCRLVRGGASQRVENKKTIRTLN